MLICEKGDLAHFALVSVEHISKTESGFSAFTWPEQHYALCFDLSLASSISPTASENPVSGEITKQTQPGPALRHLSAVLVSYCCVGSQPLFVAYKPVGLHTTTHDAVGQESGSAD